MNFRVYLGILSIVPVAAALSLALKGIEPDWSEVIGTAVISVVLVVWGSLRP